MPTFWYKAIGAENTTIEGTITAASRREALHRLMDAGRHPLDLREQGAGDTGKRKTLRFGKSSIRVATFARQLATLSVSGIPIVRSLTVLIDQSKEGPARDILTDVRESVQSGSTFAEALANHPNVFPPLMTSMVQVGEVGGTLDEQLMQLSNLYEKEESLRGEVKAALAYPILVLILGITLASVLVTWIIPQFKMLFDSFGQALPLPTRVMLAVSDTITDHGLALAAGFAVLIVAVVAAMRRDDVRYFVDKVKLRVPVLGPVLVNLEIARLTRLLGTLTQGGISIVNAFDMIIPAISNKVVAEVVRNMTARIRTGESLAALMKENELFPPLSVQMVAVGEETGLLDQMLLRVADAYDRETTASTKVMTSLLAPALILVVAVMVCFILLSVLLPIFQLSSAIE